MFPGILIGYPQSFSLVLLGLVVLLWIIVLWFGIKKKALHPCKVLAVFGGMLGSFVLMALFGTLVAYMLSVIHKRNFSIVYLPRIPFANLIVAAVLLFGSGFFLLLVKKLIKKRPAGLEALLGGILVNILLSVLSCLYLPGASYLFIIPALLADLYGVVTSVTKKPVLRTFFYALVAVVVPILYIPLVYMFYLALTFGATGIIALFALIALSALLPVLNHYLQVNRVESSVSVN